MVEWKDPRGLWALIIFMLAVVWVMLPLGSFYRYVREQHCLLILGHVPQTTPVTIEHADISFTPRFGSRYQVVLTSADLSFYYNYEGYDRTFDQTLYHLSELVPLLQRYQAENRPIEVQWIEAPLLYGDEPIIGRINGERVPGRCNLWWFFWYVPLFLFFVAFTMLIVVVIKAAVAYVDDNPDAPPEAVQMHMVEQLFERLKKWVFRI